MSGDRAEAVKRIRAYADAVPTLYDDDDPMPEGLILDTATDWTAPVLPSAQHDLLYADLLTLLDIAEESL